MSINIVGIKSVGLTSQVTDNFIDHEEVIRIWEKVRSRMRAQFGDSTFQSWLEPVGFVGIEEDRVRLSVESRFSRDWIQSNYAQMIRKFWSEELPSINGLSIEVQAKKQPVDPRAANASLPERDDRSVEIGGRSVSFRGRQSSSNEYNLDQVSAGLDSKLTFDSFVVGSPNELAYAAARRVAENEKVAFNPLFLYGGVGLGKTHLMHAIAWHIRTRQPERRVVYLSAEKFMYLFVRSLRHNTVMDFKETFRSVDVLMIDDIQFIGGREATQEEFFHTFNDLANQNSQIIVSADRSPTDLEKLEERLRSRLGWGLVADIHPTNYELRLGILQNKVEQLGISIPENVLEFLAHRITSNVRELEGALNRLAAHTTLIGRSINIETVHDVLHDLLRASDRKVTIDEIQRKVAAHYNVKYAEMSSARRARAVARPRQVAMYLAKQLTSRSLPEIGRKFGGRDHTTVMHAVKKIEELKSLDTGFADDVELLRRILES
jgi:chromosomal replication initiator protein